MKATIMMYHVNGTFTCILKCICNFIAKYFTISVNVQALDDETLDNEGIELSLVDQMKDLLLDSDSVKDPKISKSSSIFQKASMSTKVVFSINFTLTA